MCGGSVFCGVDSAIRMAEISTITSTEAAAAIQAVGGILVLCGCERKVGTRRCSVGGVYKDVR